MLDDKTVTINFNSSNINQFSDWFPSVCRSGSYDNEYMFDGAQNWILNNLNVTGYSEYDIVRTESDFGSITCNDCYFKDITSKEYEGMFFGHGSIHFVNTTFESITSEDTNLITTAHGDVTGVTREFSIVDCTFNNVISGYALLYISPSWNDVKFCWMP